MVAEQGIVGRGTDGGGLRRRPSPAEKRGKKFVGATGVQFTGEGASTRLRELVSSDGRRRASLGSHGDGERPPGQGKAAGELWRTATGAARRLSARARG
uniref:DUF591 domain-containing protein n=1 Tax=Oryza barthii TaxID=65489 RepID=A0A679BDP8_9ORYZ|nr:hypothetical protein [Oryza barthii]